MISTFFSHTQNERSHEMKKNSFKRILSFFLAAVMLFGMLPAVFAQDADTKDVDYAITNPYATVDWKNYGQYKASLQTATMISDMSSRPTIQWATTFSR